MTSTIFFTPTSCASKGVEQPLQKQQPQGSHSNGGGKTPSDGKLPDPPNGVKDITDKNNKDVLDSSAAKELDPPKLADADKNTQGNSGAVSPPQSVQPPSEGGGTAEKNPLKGGQETSHKPQETQKQNAETADADKNTQGNSGAVSPPQSVQPPSEGGGTAEKNPLKGGQETSHKPQETQKQNAETADADKNTQGNSGAVSPPQSVQPPSEGGGTAEKNPLKGGQETSHKPQETQKQNAETADADKNTQGNSGAVSPPQSVQPPSEGGGTAEKNISKREQGAPRDTQSDASEKKKKAAADAYEIREQELYSEFTEQSTKKMFDPSAIAKFTKTELTNVDNVIKNHIKHITALLDSEDLSILPDDDQKFIEKRLQNAKEDLKKAQEAILNRSKALDNECREKIAAYNTKLEAYKKKIENQNGTTDVTTLSDVAKIEQYITTVDELCTELDDLAKSETLTLMNDTKQRSTQTTIQNYEQALERKRAQLVSRKVELAYKQQVESFKTKLRTCSEDNTATTKERSQLLTSVKQLLNSDSLCTLSQEERLELEQERVKLIASDDKKWVNDDMNLAVQWFMAAERSQGDYKKHLVETSFKYEKNFSLLRTKLFLAAGKDTKNDKLPLINFILSDQKRDLHSIYMRSYLQYATKRDCPDDYMLPLLAYAKTDDRKQSLYLALKSAKVKYSPSDSKEIEYFEYLVRKDLDNVVRSLIKEFGESYDKQSPFTYEKAFEIVLTYGQGGKVLESVINKVKQSTLELSSPNFGNCLHVAASHGEVLFNAVKARVEEGKLDKLLSATYTLPGTQKNVSCLGNAAASAAAAYAAAAAYTEKGLHLTLFKELLSHNNNADCNTWASNGSHLVEAACDAHLKDDEFKIIINRLARKKQLDIAVDKEGKQTIIECLVERERWTLIGHILDKDSKTVNLNGENKDSGAFSSLVDYYADNKHDLDPKANGLIERFIDVLVKQKKLNTPVSNKHKTAIKCLVANRQWDQIEYILDRYCDKTDIGTYRNALEIFSNLAAYCAIYKYGLGPEVNGLLNRSIDTLAEQDELNTSVAGDKTAVEYLVEKHLWKQVNHILDKHSETVGLNGKKRGSLSGAFSNLVDYCANKNHDPDPEANELLKRFIDTLAEQKKLYMLLFVGTKTAIEYLVINSMWDQVNYILDQHCDKTDISTDRNASAIFTSLAKHSTIHMHPHDHKILECLIDKLAKQNKLNTPVAEDKTAIKYLAENLLWDQVKYILYKYPKHVNTAIEQKALEIFTSLVDYCTTRKEDKNAHNILKIDITELISQGNLNTPISTSSRGLFTTKNHRSTNAIDYLVKKGLWEQVDYILDNYSERVKLNEENGDSGAFCSLVKYCADQKYPDLYSQAYKTLNSFINALDKQNKLNTPVAGYGTTIEYLAENHLWDQVSYILNNHSKTLELDGSNKALTRVFCSLVKYCADNEDPDLYSQAHKTLNPLINALAKRNSLNTLVTEYETTIEYLAENHLWDQVSYILNNHPETLDFDGSNKALTRVFSSLVKYCADNEDPDRYPQAHKTLNPLINALAKRNKLNTPVAGNKTAVEYLAENRLWDQVSYILNNHSETLGPDGSNKALTRAFCSLVKYYAVNRNEEMPREMLGRFIDILAKRNGLSTSVAGNPTAIECLAENHLWEQVSYILNNHSETLGPDGSNKALTRAFCSLVKYYAGNRNEEMPRKMLGRFIDILAKRNGLSTSVAGNPTAIDYLVKKGLWDQVSYILNNHSETLGPDGSNKALTRAFCSLVKYYAGNKNEEMPRKMLGRFIDILAKRNGLSTSVAGNPTAIECLVKKELWDYVNYILDKYRKTVELNGGNKGSGAFSSLVDYCANNKRSWAEEPHNILTRFIDVLDEQNKLNTPVAGNKTAVEYLVEKELWDHVDHILDKVDKDRKTVVELNGGNKGSGAFSSLVDYCANNKRSWAEEPHSILRRFIDALAEQKKLNTPVAGNKTAVEYLVEKELWDHVNRILYKYRKTVELNGGNKGSGAFSSLVDYCADNKREREEFHNILRRFIDALAEQKKLNTTVSKTDGEMNAIEYLAEKELWGHVKYMLNNYGDKLQLTDEFKKHLKAGIEKNR